MCEYCEQKKKIFNENLYFEDMYWDDDKPKYEPITVGVFIDRGHLRFCDVDDCNCLDSGEKIPINFCPFCGEKIKF